MDTDLTGAEITIRCLQEEGVDYIFGYPGGAVLFIYDELFKQDKVKHVLVRHEQAAVHAADGYARSSNKVGVALVTSGPGVTNAVTGIATAYMDSIPLVIISGQVPTYAIGLDAFQEVDAIGITRPCVKHNFLVKDIAELATTIKKAFYIASTGRPGPVLVDIPKDISQQKVPFSYPDSVSLRSYHPVAKGHSGQIKKAAQLILEGKRPMIYAGGGVILSDAAPQLTELVRLLGFPCTNTLMGLGGFPATDKHSVGMLGMHGTYEANMAMHDCDLMINIGARFDDRVTGKVSGFSPDSQKIHLDIDECSINKIIKVDLEIVGDAKDGIKMLIEGWEQKAKHCQPANIDNWWQIISKWREVQSLSYKNSEESIKPEFALQTLNRITKSKKPFVSTDVGQHQMWTAQYIEFDEPKKWLTSGGLGTMGYGVPAAIGAQIANPDSLTICVSGDASFLMNMQELSTIKQYNLPVKIIIINNQYMGMVRQWQELTYENRQSQSYMNSLPDFVKLAESFGILGLRAKTPQELESKIIQFINHDGPVLFDCVVDSAENVFPMIPAGASHNEILLGHQAKEYIQKDINAV